jgi:hypothetical protein
MSERKSHRPVKVASLLEWVCKELDLQAGLKAYKVFEVWDEVVGETIAKKARPETIRNRVLVVKVSNSPWIQELQFMKEQIKEKLNESIGEKLIDDLFFQLGKVQVDKEEPTIPSSKEWLEVSLPKKELSEVENSLKGLKDPDLQSILKRILIGQKKRIRYFRGR